MKKVLLTGSSGFIGRHAIPFLLRCGYDVHAVYYPELIELHHSELVAWHRCDLLDAGQQESIIEEVQPTHLLHFAWYVGYVAMGNYWTSEDNLRWLKASMGIIKRFAENGGKRAVFTGTCAEYDWNYGFCAEDVTPTRPKNLYGVCKNSLREVLEIYCPQVGVSFAWGRIFSTYGPHEVQIRLVPSIITSLLEDRPARCTHGNQLRDFMHVQDVASAFVSLLESPFEGPINIASGEPVTIKTIADTLGSILDKPGLIELGALPIDENDPPLLLADVRRLNNVVGWRPSIDLETGLRGTIDWWRGQLQ